MIRIVARNGSQTIPEGTNRVVIGKEKGILRLKWKNIENLNERYAELKQDDKGKWEITILDPKQHIKVRGDTLQQSTFIALANIRDLKNSGDLIEIAGTIFKIAEEVEETGLTV